MPNRECETVARAPWCRAWMWIGWAERALASWHLDLPPGAAGGGRRWRSLRVVTGHASHGFVFYRKYRNGRLTYARLKTRYSTLLGHVRVLDVTFGGTLHVSCRNAVRPQLLAYAALTHLSALLVPLLLAPPLPCVHASRLVCMQLDLCACNSTCESSLDHVGRPSDLASISTPPAAAAQNAPPGPRPASAPGRSERRLASITP
jgi:hypothetical protein